MYLYYALDAEFQVLIKLAKSLQWTATAIGNKSSLKSENQSDVCYAYRESFQRIRKKTIAEYVSAVLCYLYLLSGAENKIQAS